MRARGKVVGSKGVLEGADLGVVLKEPDAEDTCDVTDAEWSELLAAAAEARNGRGVSAESVLAKLRRRQAP